MTIDPAILFFFFFFYFFSRPAQFFRYRTFPLPRIPCLTVTGTGTKAVTVPSTGQCSVNGLFLSFLSTLFRSIQQRHAAYRKQEREKKRKKERKRADRNINNKKGRRERKNSFPSFQSVNDRRLVADRSSFLGKQDALKFPQTSFRLMSTVVFS